MQMPPAIHTLINDSHYVLHEGGHRVKSSKPHDTGMRCVAMNCFAVPINCNLRLIMPNGVSHEAVMGESVFVPAGVKHRMCLHGFADVLMSSYVHFSHTIRGTLDVLHLFEMPHIIDQSITRRLLKIVRKIVPATPGPALIPSHIEQTIEQKANAFLFLRELINTATRPAETISRYKLIQRLRPALDLMENNRERAITRSDLASAACVSVSRLNALFADAMQMSPMEYLQKLRLKYAQADLIATNDQIKEIANRNGFTNPYHFSRTLKQFSGQSPTEFRQQLARINTDTPKSK